MRMIFVHLLHLKLLLETQHPCLILIFEFQIIQTQKNNPKTKCFFSLSKEKISCQEQQEKDRAGCSPKVAPTEGWIDSQRSRYVLPNFDAPLQSGSKLRFCW